VAAAASAPLVMLKVLGEMVGASVVATESVPNMASLGSKNNPDTASLGSTRILMLL
jgi:hypothetical protein